MTVRGAWAAIALVAIALIGWADYVAGPDIAFSLFYLLPILAVGWWLGRGPVLLVVGFAALTWFVADFWSRQEASVIISSWNAVTRLGIFTLVGVLTAKVRADRERLRSMLESEASLARTDALTRLPNTRALLEAVDRELARARRSGGAMSVAYLDLDNFKRVNDLYGHDEGDRLLSRVADVIRRTIRATDLAARIGGDEFVVLFWNANEATARQACNRIIAQVTGIGSDYRDVGLGISVGLVFFAEPPVDAHELLRQADAAMYKVKPTRQPTGASAQRAASRPAG